MKSCANLLLFFAVLLYNVAEMPAQTCKDTIQNQKKISLGALPAIAYDSDLGFQYGVLANIYSHNSRYPYPNYANSVYLEASKYTAGSALLRFFIDSKQLLGKVRSNFDVTYLRDMTNDFLGFNGSESYYNAKFEDEGSPEYKTRVFYKFDTQMLRLMANFKGNIASSDFFWVTGLSLLDYHCSPVDVDKLNDQHPKRPLPTDEVGLYEKYNEWGLIKNDEKNGGFNAQLRLGTGYDSRDFESNPSKGIWSEVLLSTIPNFLSSHNFGNLQLTAVHRQYFTLIEQKTIFAYRLLYHSNIGGRTASYMVSNIPSSWMTSVYSEGLGGAKTLRGIKRNRVIGDGIALTNMELRQKLLSFKWLKQDFYIATNVFADAGMVLKKHSTAISRVPEEERRNYFSGNSENLHWASGLGLKIAMSENFIVSADFGIAANKQDGDNGLYINLNYLF